MRRFYAPAEDFSDSTVTLSPEQSKHIRTVLRLSEGSELHVFDGLGTEYLCRISDVGNKCTILKILEKAQPASPESELNLTIAAALLKGDKFDLVVQKAVELGVGELIPLITSRTEVRVKHIENKLGRWRKIVIESSKQCGRAKLMSIAKPRAFEKFARSSKGTRFLFSERGGSPFSECPFGNPLTAVFGPEGGWEDSELKIAGECGFLIYTFGGRILRAETAAISLIAILQHRFGDLR